MDINDPLEHPAVLVREVANFRDQLGAPPDLLRAAADGPASTGSRSLAVAIRVGARLAVVVLLSLAVPVGCAGKGGQGTTGLDAHPPPQEHGTSEPRDLKPDLLEHGAVLGLQLGGSISAHTGKLEPKWEGADVLLWNDLGALRLGGLPLAQLAVSTEAGSITAIELVLGYSQEIDSVRALTDEICAAVDSTAQRHTPSPLGTPAPGEDDWDPAMLTIRQCDGENARFRLSVREEHDFSRGNPGGISLTVWLLEPAPPQFPEF